MVKANHALSNSALNVQERRIMNRTIKVAFQISQADCGRPLLNSFQNIALVENRGVDNHDK